MKRVICSTLQAYRNRVHASRCLDDMMNDDEYEVGDLDAVYGADDEEDRDLGDVSADYVDEALEDSTENDDGSGNTASEDEPVGKNVEEAFNKLVEKLRACSYEDLVGDSASSGMLEEVVNDPKLYALLSEGFGDGELANVTMSSSPVSLSVTSLLPSQSEIGLNNSLKFPLKDGGEKCFNDPAEIIAPIVTYKKVFIIDGHHRWSQIYMMNPKAQVKAINFDYKDQSPFRALRNFQGAVAVAQKDVPHSSAGDPSQNVYNMSEEQIRSYIDENMQDACWEFLKEKGLCEDRDGAIDYITKNAMTLKTDNPPFQGAPSRTTMPQTNEETIEIAQEGQTNI